MRRGEGAGWGAARAEGVRARSARANCGEAATPPRTCAKRPNERSEREPRGEGASRGRHRPNDPRPLLVPRSAADAPGRRERWPRDSSRQKAQCARAHRRRLLARGRAGNHVRHGRRPLAVDMRLRTGMGCRRVRLRTGGAPARGGGTFKCDQNERRRRRLRRAGGLHGGTVSRWRRRHRRPARIARRPGLQRAAASPARGSRRTPARSPAGGGVTGARLASHAGQVSSGRRRHRRADRVARRPGLQRAAASPARSSRRTPARSPVGGGVSGAQLASRRGIVSIPAQIALRRRALPAQIALRRRARGAALANHARTRASRYGGHSKRRS